MKALQSLFFRNWQRQLKYYAPKLPSQIVDTFLEHALAHKINLDWKMHLQLLNWLTHTNQSAIDPELIEELLIATTLRWSLIGLEHVDAYGMMAATPLLPEMAIGLWKNHQPHLPNKIIRLRMRKDMPLTTARHRHPRVSADLYPSYAISYHKDTWDQANWISVSTDS